MGGKVTVYCKASNGLTLRVYEKRGERMAGIGPTVQIVGPLSQGAEVFAGRGVTRGVDADFWKTWVEQNEKHPLVVSGHLRADPETGSGE